MRVHTHAYVEYIYKFHAFFKRLCWYEIGVETTDWEILPRLLRRAFNWGPPLKSIDTIEHSVIFQGLQEVSQWDPHDYREAPVPRTAARVEKFRIRWNISSPGAGNASGCSQKQRFARHQKEISTEPSADVPLFHRPRDRRLLFDRTPPEAPRISPHYDTEGV